jgi:hypothetical protein
LKSISFNVNKTNQFSYFAKVSNIPQVETGYNYKLVHNSRD